MSTNTNFNTPNPVNPSALKPRFVIRRLGLEHLDWVTAVFVHSNCFHSTVWTVLYPDDLNTLFFRTFDASNYLMRHQVESGLSYGVFDTEYVFKREESKATGGKLYWNRDEPGVLESRGLQADSARFLEQMDFPLVSIALSYDGFNPLDSIQYAELKDTLPHLDLVYSTLAELDPRDAKDWAPTGPGQVLMRNATSTRHDYEGFKTMSGLARWLMREASRLGFRGIQIEGISDAVIHVWANPPSPYRGSIISEFHTGTWLDDKGKLAFEPAQQRIAKIYVDLAARE